jgi:HK97 family phage prohead protease
MMEATVDKKKKLGYVKTVDAAERSVTSYVSTYEWDRARERFAKGAWDLSAFLKNPVVLLQHNNHEFPVGKAVEVREDEIGLLAKTVFHEETEEARVTFALFEQKFLHAFSVGFIPKKFQMEQLPGSEEKGVVFTNAELYEYSPVSVPMNPGATVNREMADLVTKVFGDAMLKKVSDDSFLVLPEVAPVRADEPEDLTAVLKQIKEMARIVKGKPMDASKLSLLKGTMDVLHEALVEAHGGILPEDMNRLQGAVAAYADVLKNLLPARAEMIQQTILQVGKALMGRAV